MRVFAALVTAFIAVYGQIPAVPSVPVEEEPQHKVALKNDFVRVLDAQLPPGYVTLNHRHDVDNVSVAIPSGRAGFAKGGYAHSVTNRGSGVMRFIVVEVSKTDRPNAAASELPKHTLETENDSLRIYRVKLAPGESLERHTHHAGWVEVTVHGPLAPGTAKWYSADQEHSLTAATDLEVVEIETK